MTIAPKNRCTCSLRFSGQPHEDGCAEGPCQNCAFLKTELRDARTQLATAEAERDAFREALETEQGAWETAADYLADLRKSGSQMSLNAILEMVDGGNPRLDALLTEAQTEGETETNDG